MDGQMNRQTNRCLLLLRNVWASHSDSSLLSISTKWEQNSRQATCVPIKRCVTCSQWMNLTHIYTSIEKLRYMYFNKIYGSEIKNLSPRDPGQNKFLITLCRNLERAFPMRLENEVPCHLGVSRYSTDHTQNPSVLIWCHPLGVARGLIQHPLLSSKMEKILACFGF